MDSFDVVVVGGGHAGCEAAAAAARRGARTALVTMDPRNIGAMSCNPAIGGIGKGHLVRELDVFDGLMAVAADRAAIHYRMLNRSKGAAVQGPRVQADRCRYRAAIQAMLAATPRLTIICGDVERLLVVNGRAAGVELVDGARLSASAVVLATGTFLGGIIYRGQERQFGGRLDERPARQLAQQLRELNLPMARLKTGTPPRLDGRTIDWARLERQQSDRQQWTFSPLSTQRALPQIACAITRTNPHTHDVIRSNLDRSPLFDGAIQGRGPRYCPSIEDKVARFGDRDGHQIFLEPEGLSVSTIYPNGISTSLPLDAQSDLVRTIRGLEKAKIVQPGYAVEYDHIDPRALDADMQVAALPGLYCAGQINGTTGYEEAAAQGLVAGLNAAAGALHHAPVLFDRSESYIGVMIDDLTLQGVSEPYRMLTARAEYRLHLRADNAPTRLGGAVLASGAISTQRRKWLEHRSELLRQARKFDDVGSLSPDLAAEIHADNLYAPYVARQAAEVMRVQADAAVSLAGVSRYSDVLGLSNEMVERLETSRPPNLGAAARVRGITPAALSAILMHVRRRAA